MTEKEKALELFNTYFKNITLGFLVPNLDVHKESAKSCALLCVDEIIEVIKDNCLEYDDNYWENVKKEIELL